MSERQSDISLGRRRTVLGLTGLMGVIVTGCSFDNSSASQSPVSTATQTIMPRETPTPIQGTTLFTYKGHPHWVNDIAWSPDSKWIVSYPGSSTYNPSGTNDYSIHIWEAATGKNSWIYQINETDAVFATLAWSPDGTRIAIPNHPYMATSAVFILDAQMGKKLVTCEISNVSQVANDYYIFQIIWSPDSTQIAVAGDMDVKICDTNTGQRLLTYPVQEPVAGRQTSYTLAWSPDGSTIASAAANPGHSIQFWDAHSGQPLHYLSGNKPFALAWSPEGNSILIRTSAGVQVQDVNTGQIVFSTSASLPTVPDEIRSSPYEEAHPHPHTVSWSPDGKYIALADGQKQVQIWNVASKSLVYTYNDHTDLVLAVAWSPDGSHIASAGMDQTVRVWQAL